MPIFSNAQRPKVLYYLAFLHLAVIASSNYLVQLPFTLFGFHTTWGAFTFPFIFLATDLTIRIFGASLARKIIFLAMFPALVLTYLVSVLFYNGHWLGFTALAEANIFIGRIALASFFAYLVGQLMDILLFNALRKSQYWWVAPSVAAIFGNMMDTAVFFSIAFYRSTNFFMASNWVEIAMVDYSFKLFICGLFFLPLYGILINGLLKKLAYVEMKQA